MGDPPHRPDRGAQLSAEESFGFRGTEPSAGVSVPHFYRWCRKAFPHAFLPTRIGWRTAEKGR